MDAVNLTQRLNSRSISVSAQPPAKSSRALKIQAFIVIFYDLIVIVAGSYVLSDSDSNCDEPIRAWVIVLIVLCCISLIMNVCGNCIFSKFCVQGTWYARCYKLMMYGFIVLSFIWIVVGSVWIFEDSECRNDWEQGYALTLVVVIFNYGFVLGLVGLVIHKVCCKK